MTKEEKMYVILALAERYNLDVAVSVNVMGIQHKLDNILLRVGSKYFDVFSGELYDRFVFDGSTCACHSDNVKEVKGFLGLHLIKCTDREKKKEATKYINQYYIALEMDRLYILAGVNETSKVYVVGYDTQNKRKLKYQRTLGYADTLEVTKVRLIRK